MSVGIQRLRDETELIRQGAIDKGEDPAVVEAALALDERRRALLAEGDGLKAERNTAIKQVGEAIRGAEPDGPEVAALRAALDAGGRRIAALDAELATVEAQLDDLAAAHPQPGRPGRPDRRRGGHRHGPDVGRAAPRRPAARRRGRRRRAGRRRHLERAPALGDRGGPDTCSTWRAARRSPARASPSTRAPGRALQRALINWFLDVHTPRERHDRGLAAGRRELRRPLEGPARSPTRKTRCTSSRATSCT